MGKGGAVAGLTRNGLVIAFRLFGHLIDMARAANRGTGKGDFFRHLSFNRRFAMQSRIRQRRRQNDVFDRNHQSDDDRKNHRQPSYLFRNLL
jgi:hypothetical protein